MAVDGKMRKAFVIPARFSRDSVPGQVPLGFATKRDQVVAERALAMPKAPTERDYLKDTRPMLTPDSVVRGMGLDAAMTQAYRTLIAESAATSRSDVQYRQTLNAKMLEDRLDPALRRALADRAMNYWRSCAKSFISIDELGAFEKAEARGGQYYRRVPTDEGKTRYYYDEAKYHDREDAHVSGRDAMVRRIAGLLVRRCPDEGYGPDELTEWADKFNPETLDAALDRAVTIGQFVRAGDRYVTKESQVYSKALDSKPGESLAETSTEELTATLAKMKSKVDDAGSAARVKAITAELSRRGGVRKSMDAINELSEVAGELSKAQSLCEVEVGEAARHIEEHEDRVERIETAFDESIKGNGGFDPEADGEEDADLTKGLDAYLSKAGGHKYVKRTGAPGSYQYEYAVRGEEGALSVRAATERHLAERHGEKIAGTDHALANDKQKFIATNYPGLRANILINATTNRQRAEEGQDTASTHKQGSKQLSGEGKLGVHVIKNPAGNYGFAGSVPGELQYVRKDGGKPSEQDLKDAKQAGPAMAGLKPRVFATEAEATAAHADYQAKQGSPPGKRASDETADESAARIRREKKTGASELSPESAEDKARGKRIVANMAKPTYQYRQGHSYSSEAFDAQTKGATSEQHREWADKARDGGDKGLQAAHRNMAVYLDTGAANFKDAVKQNLGSHYIAARAKPGDNVHHVSTDDSKVDAKAPKRSAKAAKTPTTNLLFGVEKEDAPKANPDWKPHPNVAERRAGYSGALDEIEKLQKEGVKTTDNLAVSTYNAQSRSRHARRLAMAHDEAAQFAEDADTADSSFNAASRYHEVANAHARQATNKGKPDAHDAELIANPHYRGSNSIKKSMSVDLDEWLAKGEGALEKAKYVSRTGGPGNYQYEYAPLPGKEYHPEKQASSEEIQKWKTVADKAAASNDPSEKAKLHAEAAKIAPTDDHAKTHKKLAAHYGDASKLGIPAPDRVQTIGNATIRHYDGKGAVRTQGGRSTAIDKDGTELGEIGQFGSVKEAVAHLGGSTKKSMEVPMDLDGWLRKSGGLPEGEPGYSEGTEVESEQDGGKVAGIGKQSGEIPMVAGQAPGAPAPESDKLSEDDAEIEGQMKDGDPRELAKSKYIRRTGGPGHWQYEYSTKGAHGATSVHESARKLLTAEAKHRYGESREGAQKERDMREFVADNHADMVAKIHANAKKTRQKRYSAPKPRVEVEKDVESIFGVEKLSKGIEWHQTRTVAGAETYAEARHHDAVRISQLRKSENEVVSVGVSRVKPRAVETFEKSGSFTVGRGSQEAPLYRYSDNEDRYIEKAIQGPDVDTFYPHGRPSVGARGTLQKSTECGACGMQKSMVLTSCPGCGEGSVAQQFNGNVPSVLVKSDRVGPVLRPVRGQGRVVLANGIVVVDE